MGQCVGQNSQLLSKGNVMLKRVNTIKLDKKQNVISPVENISALNITYHNMS